MRRRPGEPSTNEIGELAAGLGTGAERPRVPVLFPRPGLAPGELPEFDGDGEFDSISAVLGYMLLHLLELCVYFTTSNS